MHRYRSSVAMQLLNYNVNNVAVRLITLSPSLHWYQNYTNTKLLLCPGPELTRPCRLDHGLTSQLFIEMCRTGRRVSGSFGSECQIGSRTCDSILILKYLINKNTKYRACCSRRNRIALRVLQQAAKINADRRKHEKKIVQQSSRHRCRQTSWLI